MNTITVTPEIGLEPYYIPPRKPANNPQYIKYIRCNGARFHVLHWNSNGIHCSEKDCIVNKPNKTKQINLYRTIQESLGENIYGETYHDFE